MNTEPSKPTMSPMARMNRLREQIEHFEKEDCEKCLNPRCNSCQIKNRIEAKMGELRYIFWNADYEED